MPRPIKQGLDYFPLDVDFDDKVSLYLIEHEAEGLSVLITLWQLIYKNSYYINCHDDLKLLIKHRINVDISTIDSCILSLLSRDIFSQKLFEEYKILTSRSVQKRFFEASSRKKEIIVIKEFLLIDISDYNNLVFVDINSINVDIYPQSKVKEIKVKEIKVSNNSVDNSVDNFSQKELSDFIHKYFLDFTPLRKPNFSLHIKPVLDFFQQIPEPLTQKDILTCVQNSFAKIKPGSKVRIDYLVSNINSSIISRREYLLSKQKQSEAKEFPRAVKSQPQSLATILSSI